MVYYLVRCTAVVTQHCPIAAGHEPWPAKVTHIGPAIHDHNLCILQGKRVHGLHDLRGLDHVAGSEPDYLHDRARFSWVRPVLHRSCTTYHNDRCGI